MASALKEFSVKPSFTRDEVETPLGSRSWMTNGRPCGRHSRLGWRLRISVKTERSAGLSRQFEKESTNKEAPFAPSTGHGRPYRMRTSHDREEQHARTGLSFFAFRVACRDNDRRQLGRARDIADANNQDAQLGRHSRPC